MSLGGQKSGVGGREVFQLFLIKPSHYDDDGYVIQWAHTYIPSNSLAALYGIALDAVERQVLGSNVDVRITVMDEMVVRIVPKDILREIKQSGGKGFVGLVGVQSNQFPRAVDIARPLRAAGIPVCIGGFHAAGTLTMIPEPGPEIRECWDLGISIFSGEGEGRFDELLKDAWQGELKPHYDYRNDFPNLEGATTPFLPASALEHFGALSSFDAGRGCPFQCSFCTIINVQGRKSRYRSADDVEQIVRKNRAQGINNFIITDDNFARNRNWEPILDRLIKLREEGIKLFIHMQVDTLCHRIPNFVQKAARAGVKRVFIGLENINPDNLAAAKKKQNRITEYRTMLQAWRAHGVFNTCGYIIGFPFDTPERLRRDVEIIKRELPVDLLEFFMLTPLPGSEDHQTLHRNGVAMDPDLNNYDSEHAATAHALMSDAEWCQAYRDAWLHYYDDQHIETLIKRAHASGMPAHRMAELITKYFGNWLVENVHPLQSGSLRRKYRRDRRPGRPLESPFVFYPRYAWETLVKQLRLWNLARRTNRIVREVKADPAAASYRDLALTPVTNDEVEELEIFSATASAKQAVEKAKKMAAAAAHAPARRAVG